MSHNVGVGNRIQVFCKRNKCSDLLSDLCSPNYIDLFIYSFIDVEHVEVRGQLLGVSLGNSGHQACRTSAFPEASPLCPYLTVNQNASLIIPSIYILTVFVCPKVSWPFSVHFWLNLAAPLNGEYEIYMTFFSGVT